ELCNLADERRYKAKLVELRTILDKWIIDTGDKGQIPEDKESLDRWRREAQQRYKRDMKQKGLPEDCTPEEHLKWWEKKLLGSK
ncbi:MAG: arylsulfatase, partial [Planctomycetes bacterium]|nr:arylsulfatase [Planctomycetota bacterium]